MSNHGFPPSSPSNYPPASTALLLLDFHSFLLYTLPSQTVLTTAKSLLTCARDHYIPILHCLVDFTNPVPNTLKPAARYKALQTRIANEADSTSYVAEHVDLQPTTDQEYVFHRGLGKTSVLSSPGLEECLRGKGIESVVVSGIATSGCVIDSAKALVEAGFVVTVVEDACADREVEVHEFVLRRLLGKQCHVVGFEDVRKMWTAKESEMDED